MQMELVLFCLGNKKAVVTVNTQFVKGSQGLSSSPLCEPDRRAFLRRMEEHNDWKRHQSQQRLLLLIHTSLPMSWEVLQKNLFRPRSVYTLAVKLFVNTTIIVKWSICWSRSKYVFPLLPDTVLIKTSFYGRSCRWWVPSRVAKLCSRWAEQRRLLCSEGTWGVWSLSPLSSELP